MGEIKQPVDTTVFNGELGLTVKYNKNYAATWEQRMKQVQTTIDNEVLKQMVPYTPMRTGALMHSATIGTVIGSGKIKYTSPAARYLYYGEIYGPNIPIKENGVLVGFFSPPKKQPAGRQMQYSKAVHPLAGKLWFERMKKDKLDVLKREAEKVLKDGAK